MSKMVILCVDDENFILQSLKNELISLFDHQYLIEIAENGREAEEVFEDLQREKYTVPVVFSDYIMPGMKGDELLKRIHRLSPKTRTILLTGQAVLEGVINAINEANLFHYIEKPWKKAELKTIVSAALETYFRDQRAAEENKALVAARNDLEKKVSQKSKEFEESMLKLATMERRMALGQLAKGFLSFQELGYSLNNIKVNLDLLKKFSHSVKTNDFRMVDEFLKTEQALHRKNNGEIDKIIATIGEIGLMNSIS